MLRKKKKKKPVGFEALPLWEDGVCEACKGDGTRPLGELLFAEGVCPDCGGHGRVPIRYTLEEAYEKGYAFRDDDLVWVVPVVPKGMDWNCCEYQYIDDGDIAVLAVPGQGKPSANWRPK